MSTNSWLNSVSNKIPKEFYCPFSFEIMEEPVICDDEYTYDKKSLVKLSKPISPLTNQPININNLIFNRTLKSIIDKYNTENSTSNQQTTKQKEKQSVAFQKQRNETFNFILLTIFFTTLFCAIMIKLQMPEIIYCMVISFFPLLLSFAFCTF